MQPVISRLLLILALLLVPALTTAEDWPAYLHDPRHTAASHDLSLAPSTAGRLINLWYFATGGIIASSATVVDNVVYVGAWDGYEYALDAVSGRMKWRTSIGRTAVPGCSPPHPGVTSTATVQNGVIYVGGGDAYWYALDAASGAVLWKVYTGDTSARGGHYNWSSPLLYHGSAYIGIASLGDCPSVQGRLLRVDLRTHRVVAQVNIVPDGTVGGSVWASPTVDPATNTLYVATGNQTIPAQAHAQAMLAINAATLAIESAWSVQAPAVVDADWGTTPILFSDSHGRRLVAAANKNGIVYAFNRAAVGAGPVWQRQIAVSGSVPQAGTGTVSSGAFANGVLYWAGGNTPIKGRAYLGSVRALDSATGGIIWQHGAPGVVIAALAYVNGMVIDGAGATLEVLDARSGSVLYADTTGGAIYGAPSVSNGRIFVGATDGKIYAFGLPSSAPAGYSGDNLAAFFNNTSVTDDSAGTGGRDPRTCTADFDGLCNSYSAQALAAAGLRPGRPVTFDGITFLWPNAVPGVPDNVLAQGQAITFPAPRGGTALAFLGASSSGAALGTGAITYADGGTQPFQLGLSDWTLFGDSAPRPSYGNRVVARTRYRNPRQAASSYVFYAAVPLQSGRAVARVVLPRAVAHGGMHIFALAVGNAATPPPSIAASIDAQALAAFFNDTGITSDRSTKPGNFDGLGGSYSAQALDAAGLRPGRPVTFDGITFLWPNVMPGVPDNVLAQGQAITFPAPRGGTALAFLGASSSGAALGTGAITYADGGTQPFQIGLSDWTLFGGSAPRPSYGNRVVARTRYRNPRQAASSYVFYAAVPLRAGRAVARVTLPRAIAHGGMHIFALAVGNAATPPARR